MPINNLRSEAQNNDNFLFLCMTQAEVALDGEEPARMAESLRTILQAAYQAHAARRRDSLAASA